jgi:hypothetical protein
MDKADDDATTPPFSKLPPPIKPIRPNRIVAPPDFSPNYVPRAPAGLVAFASIPETLAASSEAWQVPPTRMPARANLVAHARPIEEWLEANNERAAGIHKHNGDLLWAPAATWRLSSRIDGKEVSAFVAAMHGRTIGFPAKYGAFHCYPIMSCRALALSFGAKKPPKAPPQDVLDQIRETDRPLNPPAARSEHAPRVPFDATKAKRLLVSAKIGKYWKNKIPDEDETRRYLKSHFTRHPQRSPSENQAGGLAGYQTGAPAKSGARRISHRKTLIRTTYSIPPRRNSRRKLRRNSPIPILASSATARNRPDGLCR